MHLPNDVARCKGDRADECQSCARKVAAQQPARWATWWMVPPVERPCEYRIEVRDAATVA